MTGRIICQFSCGAASAVATKLAIATYTASKIVIVNAFIKEEDEDNRRFLRDCERWFNHSIVVLRDEKYGASAREVWKRKRFINSAKGAPCSKALKRELLDSMRTPQDRIVLGYAADEVDRLDRFFDPVSHMPPICPLIERGLMRSDCLAIIERAGIEIPRMYRLGFNNANCIGCCKGGEGYWNKIRIHFPHDFEECAQIEENIGPGAFLFRNRKTGERFSLRQLDPNAGTCKDPIISCSFFCEAAEQDLKDDV